MSELPTLSGQEHADLERLAGRILTNDEAQMFRYEQVLIDAFGDWYDARNKLLAQKRQASPEVR